MRIRKSLGLWESRAFFLPFSCSYLIFQLALSSREASLALENSKEPEWIPEERMHSVNFGSNKGLEDNCKQNLLLRWFNSVLQRKIMQGFWAGLSCAFKCTLSLENQRVADWAQKDKVQQSQAFPLGPRWAGVLIFFFPNNPQDPITQNKIKLKWNFLSFHF